MREEILLPKMADGTVIRLAIFRPKSEKVKGVIQLVHGFGEHIGQYHSLITRLSDLGYICFIHDQRGFGRLVAHNKHKQGITRSYMDWLSDIEEIRQLITQKFPELPVVLFGHSLGGSIVLNFLLKNKASRYDRAIIESPWLRLAKPPAKIIGHLAGFAGKFSADIAVDTGLNMTYICHDQTLAKQVATDGLFHTRLSLRLYAQIVAAGEYALAHAGEINLPLLVFAAGEDHIVSKEAIEQFASQAGPNVELLEIKGGYHLLHIDEVKEQFFTELERFLAK